MIAIEIENDRNRSVFFAPLDRVLRGTFDTSKCSDPTAKLSSTTWPQPIPGVRLGLDPKTGDGFIYDSLYSDEHKPTRELIEKRGQRLGPEREEFSGVHVASWLQRMQAAVSNGSARLVEGKFPDKLPGKPIESFLTLDKPSRQDRTDDVLDKLATVLDKLATVLGKGGWDE